MDEEKILKPKDFWGNPNNAEEWIRRTEEKEFRQNIDDKFNTTIQSRTAFLKDIEPYEDKTESFLEVGAGNGRLIGALSEQYPYKMCCSIDINYKLSAYVAEKYPKVKTFIGEVIRLPFKNCSFDLVFTYQVLQHVPPEEMQKALLELYRVTKKELWLMEGYDKDYVEGFNRGTVQNGRMRTDADGGTFTWFFEKLINCYAIETPHTDFLQDMGVKLYKIKK